MNSSSCSCQCRSAEDWPGSMREMLTPNCVRATTSPNARLWRPLFSASNRAGEKLPLFPGTLAMSTLGIFSAPLDDRRGTHAYADAESDERRLPVAALQLVEHGSNDHGAGGAERMAHGNGASVHVDLVV